MIHPARKKKGGKHMKIALLTTGGTIASQPTARGLAPAMDAQALLELSLIHI